MDFAELESLFATQRAIRHFEPREVDDSVIERILGAATRAPSAQNRQPWRFIVVRDRETKRRLGRIFDELGAELYGHGAPERTPWEDVPVLIVIVSEYVWGTSEASVAALGASIYPAVQNLLLAAHALGLGAVLTTRWKRREAEVRPLLGLPETIAVHAVVPLGHPTRRYGRNKRRPIADITYRERLGTPWRNV